jgi:predicted acetyltransferase
MDKEAATELHTLLLEIFRNNNIDPPVELDEMAKGIMIGDIYMVIYNLYTTLKTMVTLKKQGRLDIKYDEVRRIGELIAKIVMPLPYHQESREG